MERKEKVIPCRWTEDRFLLERKEKVIPCRWTEDRFLLERKGKSFHGDGLKTDTQGHHRGWLKFTHLLHAYGGLVRQTIHSQINCI